MKGDSIGLHGVRVSAFIGVPDEERELAQTLELEVRIWPERGFASLGDELDGTVDYAAVWTRLREIAGERPRKLIEILAEDLATRLLEEFPLRAVSLEIRKQVLPGTAAVSVRIRRERSESGASSLGDAGTIR